MTNDNVIRNARFDQPKVEAEEAINDDGAGAIIMGKNGATQKPSRKKAPVKKPEIEDDKALVWSDGNLNWSGVGTLKVGFNVVSKESAEKWVTLRKVRNASVEEAKEYYGK